ncbi:MAG TPA: ROK family protein, partial [Acidimicrobiales bacterium]|nr:ROK family protein [Acidimicrobiales bacterium]
MPAIGVDLGGTKCLGALVDDDGTIRDLHRVPTPVGADAILAAVEGVAQELVGRAGVTVDGVGVGVPGLVDRGGVLRFAPNLPGVIDLPVGATLSDRLGLPVVVENDASAAGWGERQAGAARGRDNCILVTLGTGIGGGIVVDGGLYRGTHGF